MGIFTKNGRLQTGWASKSDGLDMKEQRRLLASELRKHCELLNQQGVKQTLCNPSKDDCTKGIFERLEDEDLTPPTDILIQAENGTYEAILLGYEKDTFNIDYLCSSVSGGGVALINKVKELGKTITLEPLPALIGYYKKQGFKHIDEGNDDTMIWVPPPKGARRTRRKKLRKSRRKHKQ